MLIMKATFDSKTKLSEPNGGSSVLMCCQNGLSEYVLKPNKTAVIFFY